MSDREECTRQLFLGQLTKEVALVLIGIAAGQQSIDRTIWCFDSLFAAVVSRSDIVCAQIKSSLEKSIELDLPVT